MTHQNASPERTSFTYDPYSPEAMRDPQRFYPTLRDQHPAWFMPQYDAYAISRYADVWNAFMDSEHFSEAEGQVFGRAQLLVHHRGNPPQPKFDEPKSMFLFTDPPVHNRFRRALAAPFLKGSVNRMEPVITELVRGRLKDLLPRGGFDLNGDFGSFVSVGATSIVMGLPLADTGRVVELVNRMVARAPDKPGPTPEGLVARGELLDVLKQSVARRRKGLGEESPVIDPLLGDALIGRPLTDEEVAVDMLAILVGGTETVPKVFSGGLLELSRHPDQLAAVKADPAANAVPAFEEMLRYSAPAQWFGRTARLPVEVAGVTVEPGQRVILLIAAANRDPREFENPDAFIWNRKARRMLSFGVGPHFCIGIHLARLEGQIMLRELLPALDRFSIHPEEGEWPVSEFQIGWTKLPIRFG
jgi:cytochrome P450